MLKLSFSSLDYLQLLKIVNKLEENIDVHHDENKVYLTASREDFESILDILSNTLVEIGFNENDNINSVGLTIEHLIDIISNKLWD